MMQGAEGYLEICTSYLKDVGALAGLADIIVHHGLPAGTKIFYVLPKTSNGFCVQVGK